MMMMKFFSNKAYNFLSYFAKICSQCHLICGYRTFVYVVVQYLLVCKHINFVTIIPILLEYNIYHKQLNKV